jgi:hypothetical protein
MTYLEPTGSHETDPFLKPQELAGTPTAPDLVGGSTQIIEALLLRSREMSSAEVVKMVYNEAIDDAANFARDLAPHNPLQSTTLLAVERELRHWLVLR